MPFSADSGNFPSESSQLVSDDPTGQLGKRERAGKGGRDVRSARKKKIEDDNVRVIKECAEATKSIALI